jgi:hypothetical protein
VSTSSRHDARDRTERSVMMSGRSSLSPCIRRRKSARDSRPGF